jgi:hypothetical protein
VLLRAAAEPPPGEEGVRIKKTMADLDSLLGIQEEAPKDKVCVWGGLLSPGQRAAAAAARPSRPCTRVVWANLQLGPRRAGVGRRAAPPARRLPGRLARLPSPQHHPPATHAAAVAQVAPGAPPGVSISPEALAKISAADAARGAGGDAGKAAELEGAALEQMKRVVEKARAMADASKAGEQTPQQEAALRKDFESLIATVLDASAGVDKEVAKKMKDGAFGPQTFWVTETTNIAEPERSGLLFRGRLRAERDAVFKHVVAQAAALFGDRYTVLMIDDPEAAEEGEPAAPDGKFGPRVAFQVVPTAQAQPPQTTGGQLALSAVLALLLAASCGQLSLVANIAKLPKETLDYFANPPAGADAADMLPPGLENWDPSAYLSTAVPIFAALLAASFAHELGHRLAAGARGVRLGPSYFIPNLQIGSFGAITPFTGLLKNRTDLWDVAAAGPAAGAAVSLGLLAIGLAQGQPGALPAELLVPVPSQLLQGSLLLGGLTKARPCGREGGPA